MTTPLIRFEEVCGYNNSQNKQARKKNNNKIKYADVYSWCVSSKGPVSMKKTKTLMSDLKSKYADKSWNETFQLVRRCMVRTSPFRNSASKNVNPVVYSLSICHVCLFDTEQERRYLSEVRAALFRP